jgi:hypothetical protein
MSLKPDHEFPIDEVLFRMTRREATPDEIEQLERCLLASEEARQAAWQFLCNDAVLCEVVSTNKVRGDLQYLLHDSPATSAAQPPHDASIFRRAADSINRHGLWVLGIAASLMGVLLVNQLLLQAKFDRLYSLAMVDESPEASTAAGQGATVSAQSTGNAIGRVSGMRDVVWGPNQRQLRFGDPLFPSQKLRIESGVVELLLVNGAKITLEGPAEFEPSAAFEAHLSVGKIAAAAPRTARGYTVFTPTAELFDIGTQFGVVVDDSGDSELYVFDGDVVARSRVDGADSKLLHARQNEAMRFRRNATVPEIIDAGTAAFVRQIVPTPELADLPPLAFTDELVAWYDASVSVDAEIDNPITSVRDILVGDNHFADDAWQFDPQRRPKLIRDGKGRPAMRFDGKSTSLASSLIDIGQSGTIVLVCAPAPISYATAPHGSTLLSFVNSPHIELTLGNDFVPRGAIIAGGDNRLVSAVQGAALDASDVAVLGFTYDSATNKSELWLNGVSQGVATLPAAMPDDTQIFLGSSKDSGESSHYFGLIYEVVLYGRSLAADEVARLQVDFDKKYSNR